MHSYMQSSKLYWSSTIIECHNSATMSECLRVRRVMSVSKSTSWTSLSLLWSVYQSHTWVYNYYTSKRVEQISFKIKTVLKHCTRKYSFICARNLLASLLKVMNILKQVCASEFTVDLPQVDSLIFLVMARYIGTIKKKTEKGRKPRNKPNIPNKPSAEGASEHQNRKSCEGLCENLSSPERVFNVLANTRAMWCNSQTVL